MGGIDFKIMFLNPESDEVRHAHKDQDIFKLELETTILRAKKLSVQMRFYKSVVVCILIKEKK